MAAPDAATPRGTAVEIEGLRVVRGGRVVLDGLSLRVAGGRVTGLLGPSGCGKSTLLRSIVGVQVVADGTVRVLGLEAGSPELRARVAYGTQAASVYDDLSVLENLRYFAAVLGAPAGDVERAIGEVGLESHADAVVGRLSGGQLSRASLAVALLNDPEVLVLDEPTVGLDPVLRRDLWNLFHRLAEEGASLLVSSHVMDEAAECDRLLLMRDGSLLDQTTPQALRDRTGEHDLGRAFLAVIEASDR
jgi:ABC-2 type transport system ATP-binding protein